MSGLFIELFAGSAHMAGAFKNNGWETFTVDIQQNESNTIDLICDINDLQLSDLPTPNPDEKFVVWAGLPCTYFSIANTAGKKHFKAGGEPLSIEALRACELAVHTLDIITMLEPDFWFLENPRGHLHQQKFMQSFPMELIYYCQYGADYQKPTMLWGNMPASFYPRNRCNCISHNQVIGKDESMKKSDRNLYPKELIKDVVNSCNRSTSIAHPSLLRWV